MAILIFAGSALIVSVSQALSHRYSLVVQSFSQSGGAFDVIYRHDTWTGDICIVSGSAAAGTVPMVDPRARCPDVRGRDPFQSVLDVLPR